MIRYWCVSYIHDIKQNRRWSNIHLLGRGTNKRVLSNTILLTAVANKYIAGMAVSFLIGYFRQPKYIMQIALSIFKNMLSKIKYVVLDMHQNRNNKHTIYSPIKQKVVVDFIQSYISFSGRSGKYRISRVGYGYCCVNDSRWYTSNSYSVPS